MNIYTFDADTGELLDTRQAHANPAYGEEGQPQYLLPRLATFDVPPAAGEHQAAVFADGAWSLVADHRGTTGYTAEGELVTITALGDTLDSLGLTAEPPAPDLDTLKAAKNAEINAARLAANFTSFPYGGKQIACDQLSRSDIDGTNGYVALNGALPPGWPGGWKAMDNTVVVIADLATWKAFYAAMFAQGNANFAHAQALKVTLAAATTAEAIQEITW